MQTKKIKHHTFMVLFSIMCCACGNKPGVDINSFDITHEIVEYDRIYSDKDDVLRTITDIEIVDHIILTQHVSSDTYNFSFIDVNKGKLVNRWARRGKGPNEYVQLCHGFTVLDGQLIFADNTKKEINYVPVSDILEKKDTIGIAKESYPYIVDFRPDQLTIINNKKVAVGAFAKGRFGILDSSNIIIDCPYDYPFDYDERIHGIYRGSTFQSKVKSNRKQSKFVIQTFASDVFEIYHDTSSGIQRVYVSPFRHTPQTKEIPNRNMHTVDFHKSIVGLTDMAVSEDLIYFAYSPQIYNEFVNSGQESNEILCFNWNGKKIKKYILPFPIDKFCVDKQYIYGVKYYSDEMVIYRFGL